MTDSSDPLSRTSKSNSVLSRKNSNAVVSALSPTRKARTKLPRPPVGKTTLANPLSTGSSTSPKAMPLRLYAGCATYRAA